MSDAKPSVVVACPACGTPGAGRFCGECSAQLQNAVCRNCSAVQLSGARFCHSCGAAAHLGAARPATIGAHAAGRSGGQRQLIVAVAVGALVAATMFVVSQRSATLARSGGSAPLAQRDNGEIASRAPDISAMSPRERAERLYDRAMRAQQEGKSDSATFFASMATIAYGQIGESTLDDHYDLGRLALLAGQTTLASSEADTILAARPTHLLGLMLQEDAARASGATAKASAAHATLIASANAERKLQLPEYLQHATEIASLLGDAGRAQPATP